MNIYIICPVRNATKEQKEALKEYKKKLITDGHVPYYPDDDNPHEHTDDVGNLICDENRRAIAEADEIHIYWDALSAGTLFDLGIAYALGKRLVIVNDADVILTKKKSFSNMITHWSKKGA